MTIHTFAALPPVGAWRLSGAYEGHEVVRFTGPGGATVLEGTTVGVEGDLAWSIHYLIEVADDWHVRRATVEDYAGPRLAIEADGAGSWVVNGERRPELDGCLDLDLEASVVTNTLPVHRLALPVGGHGASAALYVRTARLGVERLDQTYRRRRDAAGRLALEYESPRFGYHDDLLFGPDGLTEHYPGIGERVPLA